MPLSCSGSAGKGIFTARGQLCIADTDSHVKETIPGRSLRSHMRVSDAATALPLETRSFEHGLSKKCFVHV